MEDCFCVSEVSWNAGRIGYPGEARTGRVRGSGGMEGPEAVMWHEEMSDNKGVS